MAGALSCFSSVRNIPFVVFSYGEEALHQPVHIVNLFTQEQLVDFTVVKA